MGGCGWDNPMPSALGGGPGDALLALTAFLELMGDGWAPQESDADPERLFYEAVAEGLGVTRAFGEHAACQAYPEIASDYVPVYEQQLGIVPGTEDDEQRREAASTAYGAVKAADGPDLAAGVATIDARATVLSSVWSDEDATMEARPWGDSGESYGAARPASGYPAYSTARRVYVLVDVGYTGALTNADRLAVARVKTYLAKVLPTVCAFEVITSQGMLLGTSPLDYTGL